MTNSHIRRFRTVVHRAAIPFPRRDMRRFGFFRTVPTLAQCSTPPPFHLINTTPLYGPLKVSLEPIDAPQRSDEWIALRRNKLTASTFSTALGLWKGNRRYELWHEKVFSLEADSVDATKRAPMEWGVLNESNAINRYKSIMGHQVSMLGFATHPEESLGWVGASPDGLLECLEGSGILEVKCPFNKGKPETGSPWKTIPFYYMPQIQGQMEIMDRNWVDLYCWTPKGSTIFRVCRDRSYWQLIHEVLREFWWDNVVPARELFVLGQEEAAMSYKPESTHKSTGLVIHKSIKLATEAKMLCRETAGHIEFCR